MDDGSGRVTVTDLTKHFGAVEAVSGLTFSVEPGRVTGFLGPNGSGKTTTLRIILGLVAPTSGEARVNGARFAELDAPGRVVGAGLAAQGCHPGRTGRAPGSDRRRSGRATTSRTTRRDRRWRCASTPCAT